MAVRFILGRSGTGKTDYCVKTIVESLLKSESQSLVLLVPEQATYQASRVILNDSRIAGYNRLHVLSFDRLVYMLLGKNSARPTISRLGRTMVIQRILRDCSNRLTIFGNSARLPGMGKSLADTIEQLQQYANTPDDIESLVAKLRKQADGNLTTAKFADLGIVFKEYVKFIEGRFIDPDIQLAAACKAVAQTSLLRGAKLWVDGFAGFTTSELALLTELLKVARDANIAMCLDPKSIDLINPDKTKIYLTDLFGTTAGTYADLVERIKKCKIKIAAPLILNQPHRFSKNPVLAHVEHSIFTDKPIQISAGGKIRVVSAPNARAEVQFVARQITKLVRQTGLRYRDIAVIASDIDSYESYITACFEDYQIPAFIDKRKPLNQHPVIELVCSAIDAVTNDFPASEIFAYLKTDLLDIQRSDVDLLENYCVAFGITSNDWKNDKPWQYAGEKAAKFNEPHVDLIRKKAIAPLLELKNQFESQRQMSAEQFTKIVFDFLENTGVSERLSLWVEQALQRGDYSKADEHSQLFNRVVDVFDELVEAFAGSTMRCVDYLAIVRLAFSQMTLAFIPPNLDQVLVGSIERSRHPDLKAVFLIGTTEKQFPSPLVFDSILSERDHLAAQETGLDLAPGIRQSLAGRAYLAYIAFTRPSDFLYITCPASSAVAPSPFIDDLCLLFDDLKAESFDSADIPMEEISNSFDLEEMLCGRQEKSGLVDSILKDNQLATLGSRVAFALDYQNKASLDNEIIKKLYGEVVSSSASRLGDFAACPFKHFAKNILSLKKREEFKLEPLDLGNFYHRSLDRFLKRSVSEKIDFKTVSAAAISQVLNEEIEKLCSQDPFISKFSAHSKHNSFQLGVAARYLRDCVIDISKMIAAGNFRPVLSELSFGKSRRPSETVGEFKIKLDDGRSLSLNGRIDRLDITNIDGRKVALVFDYKTSESSFSWSEFYYGLDIQLAVYMLAVKNVIHEVAEDVAGAFYLPVKPKLNEFVSENLLEQPNKFAHKAKGIFNGEYLKHLDTAANPGWNDFYNCFVSAKGDQYGNYGKSGVLRPGDFDAFLKFSLRKIKDIADQITSGKIDIMPYHLSKVAPCEQCDYRPICRFDWQINNYNPLISVNKEQILKKIMNEKER